MIGQLKIVKKKKETNAFERLLTHKFALCFRVLKLYRLKKTYYYSCLIGLKITSIIVPHISESARSRVDYSV